MKRTLHQKMMFLLLGIAFMAFGTAQAQYYDDNYYDQSCCDPCGPSDPCDPCGYDQGSWDDSPWDWDECCWDSCCNSPSRVYIGPIFYHRKVDIMLDDCTQLNNIFGIDEDRSLKANLWGIDAGYEYRDLCCLYARADFRWTEGTMKGCPRHKVTDWRVEARLGYTWGECSPCGYGVTPYVGIGYYHVERKHTYVHFDGKYEAWYVPIGIYADVEITCDFTAGLDLSFAPFFNSKVDVGSKTFDIKDKGLSDRYLWRVTVPLRWQVCPDWGFELSVEPFWEQAYFDKICLVVDPANPANDRPGIPKFKEDLWGAKFLVAFKF